MRPLLRDRNLQLIFCVTLLSIMSVMSLLPALPMMIRDLGIPAHSIGWMITAFSLPGIVMAPVAGVLADRLGRRRVLAGALALFGLAGTACFFCTSAPALYFFRVLQGIGGGPLGVLNVTLIGDLFEGQERAAAMGYNGGLQAVGTAVFPVIGGLLAHFGWNWPFLLSALALPLAVLVGYRLESPEPKGGQHFGAYMRDALAHMRTRRALSLFAITLCTFFLLYGVVVTYLPVLLHQDFASGPVRIGLIISLSSLATAVPASQLGRLTARFGEFRLIRAASLFYIASMLLMPRMPVLWATLLPVTLLGLAQGLNLPALLTLLSGVAGLEHRAAIMAANGMILRLSQTVAPLLMGLAYAGAGMGGVFGAGTALGVVMLGIAALALR